MKIRYLVASYKRGQAYTDNTPYYSLIKKVVNN